MLSDTLIWDSFNYDYDDDVDDDGDYGNVELVNWQWGENIFKMILLNLKSVSISKKKFLIFFFL